MVVIAGITAGITAAVAAWALARARAPRRPAPARPGRLPILSNPRTPPTRKDHP